MKARAIGAITSDVPTTVAGRSVGCLTSIKSVAQLLFSLQQSENSSTSCLPSADLDWLSVLNFVIDYMEKQPKESLSTMVCGFTIHYVKNTRVNSSSIICSYSNLHAQALQCRRLIKAN